MKHVDQMFVFSPSLFAIFQREQSKEASQQPFRFFLGHVLGDIGSPIDQTQ